jgi:cytochrome c-type biogenesis protein CcmF
MVVMAIGILGMQLYQTTTQKTLATGEDLQLDGYTIRFDSLTQVARPDGSTMTSSDVSVLKWGAPVGKVHPEFETYPSGQTVTVAGIYSTLADDLYVVLVNWEKISPAQAPFKVYHNPLVAWLWIGSIIFILGILVAIGPEPRPEEIQSVQ